MKKVKYSVYQKLLTVMASIIMGCESTKDINEVLGPEKLAASMLGIEQFPHQSQINTLLTRTDEENIHQLENIHHELFMKHSLSTASHEDVVVDIDMSGLVANGKTYEFADKGYFPRKRGNTGYDEAAWVYQLPPLENSVRRILVQVLGSKGELTYTILYTNTGFWRTP